MHRINQNFTSDEELTLHPHVTDHDSSTGILKYSYTHKIQ